MPMWPCDFETCRGPAVRTLGECILCNRHLCSKHVQPEFHACPKWEDADAYDVAARESEERELRELLKKINTRALEACARRVRGGIPCSIPPLRYDRATRSCVMGGMNYHIEVVFEDGIKWIARIRRFNATSPPPAVRDYIIRSEVATLKFLEQTRLPAPKVFDFALEDDSGNSVGVGYILMERLPGKSLRWALLNSEQRRKVMGQLANSLIELRKYPFDQLGSLDRPYESHIGPFARESLTDFVGPHMRPIGPCSSLEQYHVSSLRLVLDLILRGEMYSQQAVDAYLIHRYLLDLVPAILPKVPPTDDKYYLKHADDKGDHILVDEEYNITGIIDWEWAHTTSPAIAFNSPIAFLPVAAFYDGNNELGRDENVFAQLLLEKGSQDLAGYVRNGRLQHRFAFCCGYNLEDWRGFVGLFRGLRDLVGSDAGLDWEEWKVRVLERYKDDADLRMLLSKK